LLRASQICPLVFLRVGNGPSPARHQASAFFTASKSLPNAGALSPIAWEPCSAVDGSRASVAHHASLERALAHLVGPWPVGRPSAVRIFSGEIPHLIERSRGGLVFPRRGEPVELAACLILVERAGSARAVLAGRSQLRRCDAHAYTVALDLDQSFASASHPTVTMPTHHEGRLPRMQLSPTRWREMAQ